MMKAHSLKTVAECLEVKRDWVRAHLGEFPNWFRLPAGTSGVNQPCGEIRIPEKDVVEFMTRFKVKQ